MRTWRQRVGLVAGRPVSMRKHRPKRVHNRSCKAFAELPPCRWPSRRLLPTIRPASGDGTSRQLDVKRPNRRSGLGVVPKSSSRKLDTQHPEFGDIVTGAYARLLAKYLNWRGPDSGKSTAESQNARRY